MVRVAPSFLTSWIIIKPPLVDQPAGTGLSYASTDKYVHTLDEVRIPQQQSVHAKSLLQATAQFLEFLRNFYSVFPEYKNVDVRRPVSQKVCRGLL
jgi:hypothetical protein